MKVKRVLQKILSIPDPINLETDIVGKLIAIMTGLFVGKCTDGCLVLSIDSIAYYSDVSIPRNDEPTYGQIHVLANITAQQIAFGEVIAVKITKITPSQILAANNHVNCMIEKKPILDSLIVGQTIPVRILHCTHAISKPKIASLAELWFPAGESVWYKIDPATIDKKLVAEVKANIATVEGELEAIDEAVVAKYSSILQPSPKQPIKPLVEMTIDELLSQKGPVFVSRDPNGNSLRGVVVVAKNDSEISTNSPLGSDEGFFALCMDYIANVQALMTICTYEDGEHVNVVRLYKKTLGI